MVWIQYSLIDGSQQGSTETEPGDEATLTAWDRGQIWYDGDPTGVSVDITQNPPVAIPPPSPG